MDQFRNRAITCLMMLLCALLPGCRGDLPLSFTQPSLEHQQGNPRARATSTLAHAMDLPSPERERLQLQAASELVRLDTWSLPAQLIHEVQPHATTVPWQQVIRAQIALLQGQPGRAQQRLASLDDADDEELEAKRHITLAQTHLAQHQLNAALEQYAWFHRHAASKDEQKRLWQAIWYRLMQQPAYRIHHALKRTHSTWIAGWLALAEIAMHPWSTTSDRDTAIAHWQQQYPAHPGIHMMRAYRTPPWHPQHIALLLPLHGDLASTGQAVRDGFLSAYFDSAFEHQARRIHIYDTSIQSLQAIQEQLEQDHIDFVVGPLAKSKAQRWTSHRPTLLLNTVQDNRPPHVYQLTLSPTESIDQVIHRAFKDGHHRAWLMADQSYWGQHLARAFRQAWQARGGVVMEETTMNPKTLSRDIAESLGIRDSRRRIQAWRGLLGRGLRALPHRHHDRDMVFLATDVRLARTVRPLLQYHFAGRLPVYATPSVYLSQALKHRDHDLDGIRFCDTPWVIHALSGDTGTGNPSLRRLQHTLQRLWPQPFKHQPHFFALGIDAYQILDVLPQMYLFRVGHRGATGLLHLDDRGHIHRSLQWMVFRRGYPVPMHHLWQPDDWGLQAHLDQAPQ